MREEGTSRKEDGIIKPESIDQENGRGWCTVGRGSRIKAETISREQERSTENGNQSEQA